MPVRAGRLRSFELATLTLWIPFLNSSAPTLKTTAVSSLISGSSGKSSAGEPLIVEEYLPALIVTLVPSAVILIFSPFGRLLTNSAKSLAGTVVTPSLESETGR